MNSITFSFTTIPTVEHRKFIYERHNEAPSEFEAWRRQHQVVQSEIRLVKVTRRRESERGARQQPSRVKFFLTFQLFSLAIGSATYKTWKPCSIVRCRMSMTMEERRVCDVRIFAIFHQKGANCLVARINGQSRESRRWHHYWVSRCSRSREEERESEFWNWKIFGEISKMSLLWCYVSYPHFGVDKSLSSLILLSKESQIASPRRRRCWYLSSSNKETISWLYRAISSMKMTIQVDTVSPFLARATYNYSRWWQ